MVVLHMYNGNTMFFLTIWSIYGITVNHGITTVRLCKGRWYSYSETNLNRWLKLKNKIYDMEYTYYK